jgi:hypothetical protein
MEWKGGYLQDGQAVADARSGLVVGDGVVYVWIEAYVLKITKSPLIPNDGLWLT